MQRYLAPFNLDKVKLESNRPCEKLVGAEEHLQAHTHAPGGLARLPGLVLGEREAQAGLEHQPVARDAFAIREFHAVVAPGHRGFVLALGEQLGAERAPVRHAADGIEREVALHALGTLRDGPGKRESQQPLLSENALHVETTGDTKLLTVLPERGFTKREQRALGAAMVEAPTSLHERVDGRAQAYAGVGLEASTMPGRAISKAKQGLVFLHGTVLPRERPRSGTALAHVLVTIHAADEGMQPLVHPG